VRRRSSVGHGLGPVRREFTGNEFIKPDRLQLRTPADWQYRDKQEQKSHSITSKLSVQQNSEDSMSKLLILMNSSEFEEILHKETTATEAANHCMLVFFRI
jgi:hypothetical protein